MRDKSVIDKFIEEGHEFILGPPQHPEKTQGVNRNVVMQKLEPRIDVYARKLRSLYHRQGIINTNDKAYLNPIRMRQPTDTI